MQMSGAVSNRKSGGPRARTRLKIVEAALAEFLEHGYLQATVEGIASRAGISRGTYYIHFESKLDALVETWSSALDGNILQLFAELDHLTPFAYRAPLRDWMDRAIAYWEETADVTVLLEQAMALEPGMAPRWARRSEELLDTLSIYLDSVGAQDRPAARLRMGLLIGDLHRSAYLWVIKGQPTEDRDALIEALTEIWWRTLRTP